MIERFSKSNLECLEKTLATTIKECEAALINPYNEVETVNKTVRNLFNNKISSS